MGVERGPVDAGVGVLALLGLGVGLGPRPLLLHERPEPVLVDAEALLGRHLQRQVDREPVGVVQGEGPLAGQLRAALLLRARGSKVEDLGALVEGLAERLLLGIGDLRDPGEVALELGVGRLHASEAHRQQLGQRRVVVAEQPHRSHRTAEQPPQHIAARLVAGRDAVANQHQPTADVVGDDPEPHVVVVVGAVAPAAQLGRLLDDRETPRRCRTCSACPAAGRRRARGPCRCRCSCSAGVRPRRTRPWPGRS